MNDNKMLQIIVDGQSSIKKDILSVKSEMKKGFGKVNERLDKIGSSVANLEDDTPTVEEFDLLERRVEKLEQRQYASN